MGKRHESTVGRIFFFFLFLRVAIFEEVSILSNAIFRRSSLGLSNEILNYTATMASLNGQTKASTAASEATKAPRTRQ
jgi:hypothetical protein